MGDYVIRLARPNSARTAPELIRSIALIRDLCGMGNFIFCTMLSDRISINRPNPIDQVC